MLEKGAEEKPRASSTGSSPLAALSLPGVHKEGLCFRSLAGMETSPHRTDAELPVETHADK